MEQKTFKIASNADGLLLDVLEVIPDIPYKGIVQFAHGMAENKERYLDFMNYLAQHGFVCIIHDHRGHGKSVQSKEDLGYFYDDDGEDIVEDVHQVLLHVKNEFPDLPVTLFGHSMGSLVVRKFIKKYDSEISKLIVCGAVGNNPMTKAGLGLVVLLEKVKGDRYRSEKIADMATGNYDELFDGDLKNRWISANEDNVDFFNNHELCGFTFTLNGFKNLFHLVKDTYDKEGWGMKNKNLPILFVAGKDDPVTLGQEKWEEGQQFLRDAGYTNVSGKMYEGMRHEILNEKDKNLVYEDILDFLNL